MNPLLITLIVVLVGAVSAGAYAVQSNRRRVQVLGRADGRVLAPDAPILVLKDPNATIGSRVGAWLGERVPDSLVDDQKNSTTLLHAGFESAAAPVLYSTIRIGSLVALPLLAFTFGPRGSSSSLLLTVVLALAIGAMGPPAMIARMARLRQDRLRKSVPDSLDLLLVCVEAGISLDAALLRVAREMETMHPELSHEFMVVNRKSNAGMTREEALRGLWERTGLDELRTLSASMIQSEKWGTSIGKVLRVYAETLRRKRKQAAEKKAAMAATKMVIPMALLILPALFVVVLGPAIINLKEVLGRSQ
jgi:tight adherence protein C